MYPPGSVGRLGPGVWFARAALAIGEQAARSKLEMTAIKVHENLRQKLKGMPSRPGVYLMRDITGEVIYVGKAINLRSRVRS